MKLLTAAVLLAFVCLGLASNHFLVGGEPISASEESLLRLQVERAKAATKFGDNHPQVAAIDQEIKLTRKLLARPNASEILLPMQIQREKAANELGEKHPWVQKLDRQIELAQKLVASSDASERLVPLQVEREHAAAELGENHPRVKELDLEIEVTSKFLTAAEATKPNTKALVSDELLATLRKLTARVDALEREVAELKANKPQ